MGRGAKDIAAFGGAWYESIRDGYYSCVELKSSYEYQSLAETEASPEWYAQLHVSEGGERHTGPAAGRAQGPLDPRDDNLVRRLERNVQLRSIMSLAGPARHAVRRGTGWRPSDAAPLRAAARTLAKTVQIEIPGVPEATEPSRSTATRCPSRMTGRWTVTAASSSTTARASTRPPTSGWRTARGRSTTRAGCAAPTSASSRIAGTTRSPRRVRPTTPRTRSRSSRGRGAGLSREHPYTAKLATFVEEQLRPFVLAEEEAQASQAGQVTEENRRRLKQAARDLGARMAEVLRRLEIEYRPAGPEDHPTATPVRLRVVPPSVYLAPEGQQTFSIHAWPEAWGDEPPESWTATIVIADEEVATVSATEVPLEVDPKDARRRRGAFQVIAGTLEDATVLEVRLGSESEIIEIAVAAEDTSPVTPTRLTFAHANYRAQPGRPKTLVLMAPESSVAAAGGPTVRLTSRRPTSGCPTRWSSSCATPATAVAGTRARWPACSPRLSAVACGPNSAPRRPCAA